MEKYPYKVDVPVLLIFFSRPGCFAKVFEQVKLARPSKLFLYQDGPREGNEKDVIGIQKCREIAEDIDWDCEVYRFYQEKNVGCDPSEYIAQKWAFSIVDKCIVLEDDDVPSQSFFPFCKELLDRYENDERINMVCGMNNLESVESPYSYLFTQTGSIWGWASWKRVIDTWEPKYDILTDTYNCDVMVRQLAGMNLYTPGRMKTWLGNKASGVEHYETINGLSQYANHRLNIVPTQNMIINIGNTPEGGTHSTNGLHTIPRGLRKIFTMNSFEIQFPLRHPKYVMDDVEYQKKLFRLMGTGHPMVTAWRNIEKGFLLLRHEGVAVLFRKIKGKIK